MNTPETKPATPRTDLHPVDNAGGGASAGEKSPSIQLPCRFLRCKEMYYGGSEDSADAGGVYWCERTQEPFGPDAETCSRTQCCANRSCYVT